MRQPSSASIVATGDIARNVQSFLRSLRASNLSPRTVQSYQEASD